MIVYRCRICTDSLFGSEKPTHCPFCGAHQKHLVPASDFEPEGIGELSRGSRENLQRALDLEAGNSAFYRGASKVADSEQGRALFATLAKMEAAHAEILRRILDVPWPEELYETGECSPSHKENLTELRKREERTINLLRRFLETETEERVKQVLEAFLEIEKDHLGLAR